MSRYQAYAEYKDFGVMWVDQIPGHWETSKLRYLFSFGKGLTITKENLTDEGVPCVNYGEVHSKFGFEVSPEKHTLKCVDYGYLKSSSNALLKNGDFVFADTSEDIDGSGNFTQLTSDSDAFAGYHTIIARPEDRKCTRFLAYVFDSVEFRTQIRTAVKGVKVFSITQAILRNADIWLPTYKERDQIANFLDHETAKIDLLIEKQQGLIALLKEKRQAVISHAVTKGLNPNAPMKDSGVEWLGEVPEHWEVLQTRRVLVDMEQGKSPECESRSADIHEWGVLKTGCVNNGIYNSEENKFLPENISPFTQFEVKNGDVLMSRASGSVDLIGSVAYVHETRAKLLLSDKVFRIYLDSSVNKLFFTYLMRSTYMRTNIKNAISGAEGMANNITKGSILAFQFALPTFQEQSAIVDFIDSKLDVFDNLISRAEVATALLQERRTALISAAVTGKIDVRDWQA
jgi:type I restriction enzyme S subunit